MNLAFSSKHPFVPNPKEDINSTRWIASLSNGITDFEDLTPNIKSAWRRLSDYIKIHGLKITNLRLEAYGRCILLVPYKSEDGTPQINGYWHSKRIHKWIFPEGIKELEDRGVGYVKAREVIITWVSQDGTIRQEIRPYVPGDEATIINDEP